jgi:cytoskeletal protein RodZ
MNSDDLSSFDSPPPEESSNRTFLIAAGILGGIVLLSIACLAGYVLLLRPQQIAQQNQAATAQALQNAQVAAALTATSEAMIQPSPTSTPLPTNTPVVVQPTEAVAATSTAEPATATVAAALTQAAAAALTTYPTATALPGTGLADQYGAPGLVIAGMALVAVIFLARRLRATPSK